MFSSIIGHSENTDTLGATLEVVEQCNAQLGDMKPAAGIVFASTWYDHDIMLKALTSVFSETHFSGCSSSGELSSTFGFRDDSICLILFVTDSISIAAGIGLHVSNDPEESVRYAIQMATHVLDGKPSLCLAFPDNLHSSPTHIIDTLHQELGPQCPIFGGFAAAATFSAKQVFQFHGADVYSDAVSILLFSGPLRAEFCISNSSTAIGGRTTID